MRKRQLQIIRSTNWRHVFLLYRWRCRFPGSGTGTFICSPSVVTRTRTTNDSGRSTMHRRTTGHSKSNIRSFGTAVITSVKYPRRRTWVISCIWMWSVSFSWGGTFFSWRSKRDFSFNAEFDTKCVAIVLCFYA